MQWPLGCIGRVFGHHQRSNPSLLQRCDYLPLQEEARRREEATEAMARAHEESMKTLVESMKEQQEAELENMRAAIENERREMLRQERPRPPLSLSRV